MKFLPLLAFIVIFTSATLGQARPGKVDIQKKIAEATPASLPQSPADGRPRTDAQDANLRGKVKSVAVRHTDEADPGYPKQMSVSEDFYDETGNRVRAIDWDDVWPVSVTVFGYVDGMRVSRSRRVEYADRENSAMQSSAPLVHTIVTPAEDPKKVDNRYEIRWDYKYDGQGRLVEETHFNNRAEILTRTTYTYENPTRRVVLHYAAGPDPLAKVVEIIDPEHRNIIEEWLYDEDLKEVNTTRYYTYKFDGRGNWTEQKVTERTASNKRRSKPVSTTHRTISYYP